MDKTVDFFTKIGRPNPLDTEDNYVIRKAFQEFFFNVSEYFMINSSDGLYGISMSPYGKDAIVTIKTVGIWPFAEESNITIEDIFDECKCISFVPKEGYMIIKFKYGDAFDIVSDDDM
jgi:hypothetical protein